MLRCLHYWESLESGDIDKVRGQSFNTEVCRNFYFQRLANLRQTEMEAGWFKVFNMEVNILLIEGCGDQAQKWRWGLELISCDHKKSGGAAYSCPGFLVFMFLICISLLLYNMILTQPSVKSNLQLPVPLQSCRGIWNPAEIVQHLQQLPAGAENEHDSDVECKD